MSVYRFVYTCICICVFMCACICACAYVCICIYVCLCIYMHIHVCIYTRLGVYICTRVGVFRLFVLSNPCTTCVCITGVLLTPACVCGEELEVGGVSSLFMVSACC